MKKRTAYLVFLTILAASILFSGCSSDNNATESETDKEVTGTPTEEVEETEEVTGAEEVTVDLVIKASNWEFDQEVYEVPLGATVNVTIVNDEGYHSAMIEGYNIDVKQDNTMTFVADEAGEFKIICSTMCGAGHADMNSKLVVTN